MKFVSNIFWTAGGIGLIAMIGMYLREDSPDYYAALAGLVAWQFAFFVIASDPARFRTLMLPAMIEKFGWVLTLAYFFLKGTVAPVEFYASIAVHGVLGLLFVAAYIKTPKQ